MQNYNFFANYEIKTKFFCNFAAQIELIIYCLIWVGGRSDPLLPILGGIRKTVCSDPQPPNLGGLYESSNCRCEWRGRTGVPAHSCRENWCCLAQSAAQVGNTRLRARRSR